MLLSNQHVSFAQQSEPTNTRHILILNNKYDPFKEINIGDFVRVILTNSTEIMGHIKSIDSTFFRVENFVVHLNEIEKISTKIISKKSNLQKILGEALIGVGIVTTVFTYALFEQTWGLDLPAEPYLVSVGLVAVGVGLLLPPLPGYYKIGKSKFLLISNKPGTIQSP